MPHRRCGAVKGVRDEGSAGLLSGKVYKSQHSCVLVNAVFFLFVFSLVPDRSYDIHPRLTFFFAFAVSGVSSSVPLSNKNKRKEKNEGRGHIPLKRVQQLLL
jgi:hypothetical protein